MVPPNLIKHIIADKAFQGFKRGEALTNLDHAYDIQMKGEWEMEVILTVGSQEPKTHRFSIKVVEHQ